MIQYNFEWNPNKAAANVKEHGISFELATEVFKDPLAISTYDDEHSEMEDRWATLGETQGKRYIVAIHTYTEHQDGTTTIRMISARDATKHEIRQYEEN